MDAQKIQVSNTKDSVYVDYNIDTSTYIVTNNWNSNKCYADDYELANQIVGLLVGNRMWSKAQPN